MKYSVHHLKVTHPSLKTFKPILDSWIETIDQYVKLSEFEDCPWWYNERANISILAGATWRLGGKWFALEEYATRKKGSAAQSSITDGTVRKGRCDLYLGNNRCSFAIEAKQLWQPMSLGKTKIPKATTLAAKDAKKLYSDEADLRVGIAFSALSIPLSKYKIEEKYNKPIVDEKKVNNYVKEWIESQNNTLRKLDAYAYYFTTKPSNLIGSKGNRIFPGIVMTLKAIKKGI